MSPEPHIDRSGRWSRLVAAASVAAVSITALGAAWLSGGEASALRALRPAADEPVRVVKAPAEPPADASEVCAAGGGARAGGWL